MNSKPIKIPAPDYPISVTVAGRRIVDTGEALILKEASYPPVCYIPRKDADMAELERTSHQTYRPYKGECTYYSIPAGAERSVSAVWTYEAPYSAVSKIRYYLVFYPDRADVIQTLLPE